MVYMLVGFDRRETWERVLYRFDRMTDRGIKPYPMVFGDRVRRLEPEHPTLGQRTLADFQRWAIRRYYTVVPFADYVRSVRTAPGIVAASRHGTVAANRHSRRCLGCAQSLSSGARAHAHYCSSTCRANHWKRRARRSRRLGRRCQSCNRLIKRSRRGDARYCSGRCRQRAYRLVHRR